MENGVRPANPTAEGLLNEKKQRSLIAPDLLNELAARDQCYKRLKAQEAKLMATPLPTDAEIVQALKEYKAAYNRWQTLKYSRLERQIALKELRTKMSRRLVEVEKASTQRKVNMIRMRLGRLRRKSLPDT